MNRALFVGINAYPGNELRGCVNDVMDMTDFLVAKCAFAKSDIRILTDGRATREAIVERLGWLLNGLRDGDRVLFYYSGHGAQMPLRGPQGDVDRLHDAICPSDFDWSLAHAITDADFAAIFASIPRGVEFVWVSDSCHSGHLTREVVGPTLDTRPKRIIPPVDIGWRLQVAEEKGIRSLGFPKATEKLNLALIAGCKSEQTSADAVFDGRPNGVLSYYLLKELKAKTGLRESLKKVVSNVRIGLRGAGYDQVPQLQGSPATEARGFLTAKA